MKLLSHKYIILGQKMHRVSSSGINHQEISSFGIDRKGGFALGD
jgi:hypothetical protein